MLSDSLYVLFQMIGEKNHAYLYCTFTVIRNWMDNLPFYSGGLFGFRALGM